VAGESSGSPIWGLSPGAVVAGYRVEARIGAGGMAVVFRARDVGLGRTVALKVLAPALAGDRGFRERFIRESRAAAAVDHPHIIPVYAAGEADGVLYIAMRYVPSGDLRELLRRDGKLTAGRASRLLFPLASALDAGHLAGLVHRDVKPANILIDTANDMADHPYLADFGLAKGSGSTAGITGTGQFIGTLEYAAPEQISGKRAVPQTDQYALACAAFTMLTGAAPFPREEPTAVLWAHMSEPPPPVTMLRPDLPRDIDQVTARAMAKTPEERYPTCTEFAEAFRTALGVGPLGFGARSPTELLPAAPVSPDLPVPASYADTVTSLPSGNATRQAREDGGEGLAAGLAAPPPPGPDSEAGRSAAEAPGPKSAPGEPDGGEPAAYDGEPAAGNGTSSDTLQLTQPSPPGYRKRRRRALVIAAVAAVAVAGGGGSVLAVHPWIHPPVLRPAGLAVQGKTTSSLTIDWSGPAAGPRPDTYEILRNGTVVGTAPGTATSYTDSGLPPGSQYLYQVIAVRGGEQSPVSGPLTGETALLRPAGLVVRGKTTSSLTIDWSGPAAGPRPDTYEILRNGTVVGTAPGTATSYTDSGLAPDSPYSYQVIAVRGGEQSPTSSPLAGHTTVPPLSDARLDWNGNVTYKMQSLYPAAPRWDKQPGDSWQDLWSFTPRCSSGPCGGTLNGAYDGNSFTATLTRSGMTYSGTAEIKNDFYCTTRSNTITATMTIKITAKSAGVRGTRWVVESFSGTATLYVPAEYSCSDDTAQHAVKSG
jgi:serine/threonine protein kinase/chitodextrinase